MDIEWRKSGERIREKYNIKIRNDGFASGYKDF